MKKKRKTNENGGITLIALVVTIVSLLILAGVTIASLNGNNGILNNAKKAKEKTEKVQIEEQVQLAVQEALADGLGEITSTELLEKGLNNNIESGNYTLSGDIESSWQVTVKERTYIISSKGEISQGNWLQKSDGTIQSVDGTITLTIGDYINYDPTNGGTIKKSYMAPQGTYIEDNSGQNGDLEFGTGYSETQDFSIDSNTSWRILGIENGKILLISADTLKNELYLRGQTGYQYGVEILNNISEIYGYGTGAEGARVITVEDVNKVTGYNPKNTRNRRNICERSVK